MARIVMLLFPTGPLDSVPPLHQRHYTYDAARLSLTVYITGHRKHITAQPDAINDS